MRPAVHAVHPPALIAVHHLPAPPKTFCHPLPCRHRPPLVRPAPLADWPPDWDEGCREVQRYFKEAPPSLGSMEWAPWANYDFDPPVA